MVLTRHFAASKTYPPASLVDMQGAQPANFHTPRIFRHPGRVKNRRTWCSACFLWSVFGRFRTKTTIRCAGSDNSHSNQRISEKMNRKDGSKSGGKVKGNRSEEHTSELQSLRHLVCR